jgi:hypothetical protein
MADDIQKLLVQVDASVELLRRNLIQGEQQVAQFQRRTQANLTLVERHFQKMSAGATTAFSALRTGLAAFGASFGIAALIAAGKSALEYAGHLGELADTLGVTTKDLQEFSFAAGQVGVSQEALENALQKLRITMGQMAVGAEAPKKALEALRKGLSDQVLAAPDTGAKFRLIADAMSKVSDSSKRAAVEVALFKKAGAGIDNLLSGAQGSLNELSAAAQKLGIVLSDEQIQNADKTADKLRALKTVLEAQIAAAVADNADSIYNFANSLAYLVSKIGTALGWVAKLRDELNNLTDIGHAALIGNANGIPSTATRIGQVGRSVSIALPPATPAQLAKSRPGGADVGDFLAGEGKKDHSAEEAERKRIEALNKQFRVQEDELQADLDILRAKQDASNDYVEQTTLAVQIADKEREIYDLTQDHRVAIGEISATDAKILKTKYDQADAEKRKKLLADEQVKRAEEVADIEKADYDRKVELLGMQADLARTADERRKIQHEILDAEIAYKRKLLQDTIDNPNASDADRENARRDLVGLPQEAALKGRLVDRANMNPLQQWADSVPKSAAEITEALQGIGTQGLDRLADSLTEVVMGTKSLGDAFKEISHEIIAEIIHMTIRMLIFRAISGMIGGGAGAFSGVGADAAVGSGIYGDLGALGLPGLATGGPARAGQPYIVGEKGPELFVPNASGIIVPKVPNMTGMGRSSANSNAPIELIIHSAPSDDAWAKIDNISAQRAGQAVKVSVDHTNRTLRQIARPKLMGGGRG